MMILLNVWPKIYTNILSHKDTILLLIMENSISVVQKIKNNKKYYNIQKLGFN